MKSTTISPADASGPQPHKRDAKDLYRLLVDRVQDYAIFALDPQGHILSWNAGAEHLKGYVLPEILGKHFSIFYPPDDLAAGKPAWELEVATAAGQVEDEGWRVRKDGSRFWASVLITALRDEDGELLGFAKVTRDLTARRQAEEELRQSEERFRLLVQSVTDYAIFMLDPAGNVATWNTGAERIKGYTAAEIIGKHFSAFYPPEDLAAGKPERELRIAASTGEYEEEGWRVRKDGTRFWASVVLTTVRLPDGSLAGFAKVTRDLTERRAAQERALEDARRIAGEESARVEAEARAHELRLLAAELEERRHEAEVANRAKREFLAAMSHELRTPLNAIGGHVELMAMGLRGPVTDEQRDALTRIDRNQRHLLGLINDILNLARIEAGRVEYVMTDVSLAETLADIAPMIEPQLAAKGLHYEIRIDTDPIVIRADREKLQQILLNLLSNAVKFTDAGGQITVDTAQHERMSGRVFIRVSDTGRGIPRDKLSTIFEPFTQIAANPNRTGQGTGLGLAISRDLARGMQGDLRARSELGTGSTFTLTLLQGVIPSDSAP